MPDEEVPDAVRERNWIPFDGDFDSSVDRVVAAVDTDLDWVHDHTRWLVKSRDWEAGGRDRSRLLRGSELAAAERWLAGEAGKQPEPTALQREFVLRSRAAATADCGRSPPRWPWRSRWPWAWGSSH